MDSLLRELADIDAVTALRCDYLKTLALLRALKAGTMSLDEVTMKDGGWDVMKAVPLPPAEPPAAPNGEPPADDPAAPVVPAAD